MKKMQQPPEYNYVLVFTGDGPKFVTSNDYQHKECHWDGWIPMEFEHNDATYVAFALTMNGHYAIGVSSRYKIETQPYDYRAGQFDWIEKKETKQGE